MAVADWLTRQICRFTWILVFILLGAIRHLLSRPTRVNRATFMHVILETYDTLDGGGVFDALSVFYDRGYSEKAPPFIALAHGFSLYLPLEVGRFALKINSWEVTVAASNFSNQTGQIRPTGLKSKPPD